MSIISNLIARFSADTTAFDRGTQRARRSLRDVSSESLKTQKALLGLTRGALAFAGVGGGIYAIQRGVRSMIRDASDAQETLSKFNVVFKDQAAAAARWSEDFGDKVGRSTQDVQKWMASLQDLFVPLGFARDKAMELSKSVTQLSVDVGVFTNNADADVIRDLTSALIGNHETVHKYGVIITEASLKQEALNKGIKKNYSELSNLEKVELRYGIIRRSTADAHGAAIRNADSYASQVRTLRANIHELSVEMGNELLPTLSDLAKAVNENKDAWGDFFGVFARGMREIIGLPETLKSIQQVVNGVREYEQMRVKGWKSLTPVGMGINLYAGYKANRELEEIRAGSALPQGRLEYSPRSLQRLAEMRAIQRAMTEGFQGRPLPGTEYGNVGIGDQIERQLSGVEDLVKKMQRENELLGMNNAERAEAVALDHLRQTAVTDYNAGLRDSADLSSAEIEAVRNLAAENMRLADQQKEQVKGAIDIAAAYVRMYDSIDSRTVASYEARRKLIEQEYAEYEKLLGKTLEVEQAKQDALTRLAIEQAKGGNDFFGGMRAGFEEMKRELPTLGQLGADLGRTMRDGLVSSLTDAVFESRNLGDALEEVGRSMAKMLFQFAMQQAFTGGMGMFGLKAGVAHGGWDVGRSPVPSRTVSPAVFARAPRLHSGLRPDEFPAILQYGERVQSRDEVAASKSGGSNSLLVSRLDRVISLLHQRQTINLSANVVDKRDVVTKERMEGREGEKYVMYHSGRNNG